ncbi:MAG: hypothetical protein JXA43_00330, partial [Candidatus Diapherotrites archaeon]|nr:hypothetical protein [Candidatus Diapherotrites archaeon]
MADRRIGRKPQKRKGLFSFFSKKERKPIPERPQAKQLGKKTQARKPGEVPIGKRPVRGKPVPPQEEFKAMRKNMDLAKKAGKTIKLTRAQVERYNQLAKKFGKPPLKER